MSGKTRRELIVETGKMLLETGLVARTWGNVSARVDGDNFLITPSGLDYMNTTEDDIALVNISTGEWAGPRKPSGERGVHAAAYEVFEDVKFVIHTHQTYATAIGLAGYEELDITDDELMKLGGIAVSEYGMTGTKKLIEAVTDAMQAGAETVFMPHHGVLICGRDRDETMMRAMLLEEICQRNCLGQKAAEPTETMVKEAADLLEQIQIIVGNVELLQNAETMKFVNMNTPLVAQIEDMAQMVGRSAPIVLNVLKIAPQLKKHGAVMVPGIGIMVHADTEDDTEALKLLMDKAVKVKLHTMSTGKKAELGLADIALEHMIYTRKYSKQKNG
ncbi:MAG: class II aldolase/adducin family protein [Eubacterium sp.]|nr:class II aldolase/adducin family protein [Candidatus Colimonas fimequi]